MNAARTRELILDSALALFAEQGYDETTLDDVAERAGVSLSTLYRYFHTKDTLVLEPAALHGQMAAELRSRPDAEPLDVALGHSVVALLTTPRGSVAQLRKVSAVIEASATLRSRLRHEFVIERVRLEEAIAERLDRPRDDIYVTMTARLTMAVWETAATDARLLDDQRPAEEQLTEAARRVMDAITAEPPTAPSMPA
jgi:AcrR family transcriptional regulator